MTLDIRKEFLNFLLENDCLEAFISNENSYTQIPRDAKTLKIITHSFTYSHTEEGSSFWGPLNSAWYNYISYKKSAYPIEMYSLKEIFEYLKKYQKSEHLPTPLYW